MSHCTCVNHLLGNTEVALHVTLYLCQSFTSQHRNSIIRHIVSVAIIYQLTQKQYCTSHCICINHLLGNTEVVLYITLYVSIIYWEIQKQYCTSHCNCVNHLLVNTGVVLYVTLYLCHSSTSKHRSSLVRYNVCANHLLVNA